MLFPDLFFQKMKIRKRIFAYRCNRFSEFLVYGPAIEADQLSLEVRQMLAQGCNNGEEGKAFYDGPANLQGARANVEAKELHQVGG